jgi:hypothetical protein
MSLSFTPFFFFKVKLTNLITAGQTNSNFQTLAYHPHSIVKHPCSQSFLLLPFAPSSIFSPLQLFAFFDTCQLDFLLPELLDF